LFRKLRKITFTSYPFVVLNLTVRSTKTSFLFQGERSVYCRSCNQRGACVAQVQYTRIGRWISAEGRPHESSKANAFLWLASPIKLLLWSVWLSSRTCWSI